MRLLAVAILLWRFLPRLWAARPMHPAVQPHLQEIIGSSRRL